MAIYKDPTTYTFMSMPKAINRTNPQPVDKTLVWNSLEALQNYAATDPVAYVGQILSLVAYDEETSKLTEVKAYIIKDELGNIEEVGSATLGDDKTIALEEGVLSLKNWGKEYYKWIDPVGEEGEDGYVAGHHEKYEMKEGDTWPAGLEPKAATASDGTVVLAWYQPSTTTIEGVSSAIASVQNTVAELTTGIGSREDAAGTETVYGAINKVEEDNAANAEAIKGLQEAQDDYLPLAGGTLTGELVLSDGSKAASESVVDTKIAAAVESAGHLQRAIVTSLPAVEEADADTIYMVKVEGKDEYQEYIIVEGKFELIGNTAVDLTPYVQKVENAVEGNLASLSADGALVDAGILASDVQAHITSEEVHITAQERIDWNAAKSTADQAASDIAALVKISQDDADKLAALPGIKSIGANLELGEDGTLSAVAEQYELPAATADVIGGVKVAAVNNSGLVLESDGSLAIGISATANGLKKASDGLALELATADNAGAMSAAMFSKLNDIADGAQVNVIEGALLDGIAATIENKQLVIPTASSTGAGLVYSSAEADGVAVDENGLMSVNSLSTSKLYIPEGDELILNGGDSQK